MKNRKKCAFADVKWMLFSERERELVWVKWVRLLMRIGQQRKRAREVGQGGRKGWKFFNVFFLFSSPRELSTLVPPGQPRAPLLYTKIMRNFLSFSAFSFKNLIFFPSLLLGCLEFFQQFFSLLFPLDRSCVLFCSASRFTLTHWLC